MDIVMKNRILKLIKEQKISPEVGVELLRNRSTVKKDEHGYTGDEIVVVGMSGKFPGADNIDELWKVLKKGQCVISDIPRARWNWDEWIQNSDLGVDIPEEMQRGGFLSDLESFDASFFDISTNEAKYMDPAQRLFIQEAWKALEDAGYSETKLYNKKCGVFVGCQETDYVKNYSGSVNPFISTGSSKSILASRVSYYLNLKGPAVSVDTACSSALSALQIACQSIKDGSCEIAIVGGVLTLSHPAMFTGLASLNMFSPDGYCRVFDEGANGTVIGEAVGAVVLKKLRDARKDGNHIYGIIKAIGWNQDGKTSGITAPSAVSQAELEKQVYEQAKINPETVSYIEAHGTGTKLGDPIEIQALTDAFSQYTQRKQFCAIGSIKSNIGHTMPAAGIVSLIKVLCCMQHKMLVPSGKFEKENTLIPFKESPFYVNNELKEWKAVDNTPLRAAISSFGFSGTNCHVLVEEYKEELSEKDVASNHSTLNNQAHPYYIVPVSAKSKSALESKVTDLYKWLEQNPDTYELTDICYTLCYCRSHWKHRICFVISNVKELMEALSTYAKGEANSKIINGNVNLDISNSDTIFMKYYEIAKQYVIDKNLQFDGLYKKEQPKIVSLPAYPFDKKKYWLHTKASKNIADSSRKKVEDIQEKSKEENALEINIAGNEYFATNHIIYGNRILPGAMQIAMAWERASKIQGQQVKEFTNIIWVNPDVITGQQTLTLNMVKKDDEWQYQLNNEHPISQGEFSLVIDESKCQSKLDIEELKRKFTYKINHQKCYELFKAAGFNYQNGFSTITNLFTSSDEALAEIDIPDFVYEDEKYLLCTSIDAAFQTTMGIVGNGIKKDEHAHVPFLLEQMLIWQMPSKHCFIYASLNKTNKKSKLAKYNLAIINEDGRIAIEIKNFSLKQLEKQQNTVTTQSELAKLLYLKTNWIKETLDKTLCTTEGKYLFILSHQDLLTVIQERCNQKKIDYDCYIMNSKEQENELTECVNKKYDSIVILNQLGVFELEHASVEKEINQSLYFTYKLIQRVLQAKRECKVLYVLLNQNKLENPSFEAMDGFINTLNLESRKLRMKYMLWENQDMPKLEDLINELACMEKACVKYSDDKRWLPVLEPLNLISNGQGFKKNGLYVITGGSGNLGKKVTEYLIKNNVVNIVLIGRRKQDQELNKLIQSYEGHVQYVEADLSKYEAVEAAFEAIKALYPHQAIDGIIHCAGVLQDALIVKKPLDQIQKVLEPKIYATLLLCLKAQKEKINNLILFSSTAAVFGNLGQADYAYANSFMNHFALHMQHSSTNVISISWPFWEDGGMGKEQVQQHMANKESGIYPMPDEKGLEALQQIISSNMRDVIVMFGEENKLYDKLRINTELTKNEDELNIVEKADDDMELKDRVRQSLLEDLMMIAADFVTGCDEEMQPEDDIQDYGFDSVTLTAFCNEINDQFKTKITPAFFFELDEPNIKSLRDSMFELYQDLFTKRYEKTIVTKDKAQAPILPTDAVQSQEVEVLPKKQVQDKVAIIGMNAVLPQSKDIQEYWKQLIENKEMISNIPEDREVYLKDMTSIRKAGFMEEVNKFDPEFFHMSPREANSLDPQVRIILELIWKAIEDAGYNPKDYQGKKIGVYLGISSSDYCEIIVKSEAKMDASMSLGISSSLRANRISYIYDFKGPSEPIDTACSSSLVAVHHGMEALKSGSCDIAIAAGVNVILSPTLFNSFDGAGMLSKEGRCKTFDENADGYVRGEGAGVIVLKPLDKAEQDKDDIYAVICASEENHGGHAKSLTSPNAKAQAQLIVDTYKKAHISPETVTYIEAHGTGTQIGDPVEVNGLKKAFKQLFEEEHMEMPKAPYCGIGAVKSNIGHLEAASGIAGIIKVVLAMKNEMIPATINYHSLNPYIELEDSPFYIVDKNKKWEHLKDFEGQEVPLRAGISSFGYGGANAHIVIEEYKAKPSQVKEDKQHLFVFSAKSKSSLNEYVSNFAEYLEPHINKQSSKASQDEIKGVIAKHVGVVPSELDDTLEFSEYCNDAVKLSLIAEELNEKLDTCFTAKSLMEAGTISNIITSTSGKDVEALNLNQVEYVLKCGRCHMEERLAVIADTSEQLYQKLKNYIAKDYKDVYISGENYLKTQSDPITLSAIEYVNGEQINWQELYKDKNPGKLHLPTYCFAREVCWFEKQPGMLARKSEPEKQEKELEAEPKTEQKVECAKIAPAKKLNLIVPERSVSQSNTNQPEKTVIRKTERRCLNNMINVEKVKSEITQMIADVLYLEPNKINDTRAFMDLGLDSILGVELVRKLKEKYQIDIKATKIYDYSNINELTEYTVKMLGENQEELEEKEKQHEPKYVLGDKKPTLTMAIKEPACIKENVQAGSERSTEEVSKIKLEDHKALEVSKPEASRPVENAKPWRDIAIIGMSARFPKSKDLNEMWENLKEGNDCITEVPSSRWDLSLYENDPDMYCKWGGFLEDIDQFDPLFFNLSPADAEVLDPQQRVFVMEVWKALENAGYSKEKLDNKKCGIYAGVMTHSEYCDSMFNAHSMLAARAAYFLNLKGPALSIDTACSSSLVATHLACRSLIDGEVDMMVAGGVTLYLSPKMYQGMGYSNMLSHDGKCKAFDNSADGFIPGDGASVVVLKLLDKAIEDGDHIYGVIKGSGTNQDGRTNGITAPSAKSQTELECSVYDKFGINPEKIQYVECHGTGTKLGDPIEIEALTDAFKKYTNKKQFCRIGSMKTNFGHTSAASGVGSLIKVLLSMKHEMIPPTINYVTPNEHIDFAESPFIVNTENIPWKTANHDKKCAAVSAFGYSGTNAHLVVEEYIPIEAQKSSRSDELYIIPLSGRTQNVVNQRVSDLKKWLDTANDEVSIEDLCYTLSEGRTHFDYRICFVVTSIKELKQELENQINGLKSEYILYAETKNSKEYGHMIKQLQNYIIDNLVHMAHDSEEYKEAILALADLYIKGYSVNWSNIYGLRFGQIIDAPSYPFDLKSYWKPQLGGGEIATSPCNKVAPLCGKASTENPNSYGMRLTGNEFFIRDNQVYGRKVVPGVAYLEMIKSSIEEGNQAVKVTQVKNMYWLDMIDVNSSAQEVIVKVDQKENGGSFIITSANGKSINAQGMFDTNAALVAPYYNEIINVEQIKNRCTASVEGKECYEGYKNRLFIIGDSLQAMEKMYYTDKEALSILRLPNNVPDIDTFKLHPSIMDAVLQTVTGLQINMENSDLGKPYLSFSIGEILFIRNLTKKCYAHATLSENQSANDIYRSFDVQLLDMEGRLLVVIKHFVIKQPMATWQQDSLSNETVNKSETVASKITTIKKETIENKESLIDVKNIDDKTCKEQCLKEVVEEICGLLKMKEEEIDPQEELLEYGFSSITLIQFVAKINERYHIDADTTIFFDADKITAMSIMESLYSKYKQNIIPTPVEEEYNEETQLTIKEIYEFVLADVLKQFKKSEVVKEGKVKAEEVEKVKQYLADSYLVEATKCNVKQYTSFAAMIKEIVRKNKSGFQKGIVHIKKTRA